MCCTSRAQETALVTGQRSRKLAPLLCGHFFVLIPFFCPFVVLHSNMSDSDGDFSDELLELAGASEKKRKKSSASRSTKRRKAAE